MEINILFCVLLCYFISSKQWVERRKYYCSGSSAESVIVLLSALQKGIHNSLLLFMQIIQWLCMSQVIYVLCYPAYYVRARPMLDTHDNNNLNHHKSAESDQRRDQSPGTRHYFNYKGKISLYNQILPRIMQNMLQSLVFKNPAANDHQDQLQPEMEQVSYIAQSR